MASTTPRKRYMNPLIEESFTAYFSRWRTIIGYQIYAVLIAAIMLLSWPKDHYLYYVQYEKIPSSFSIVVVAILLCVSFLNTRFGTDRVGRNGIHPLSDWIQYTKIPVGKLLRGELVFFGLHTLFLVAISLPFIFVATAPAGLTWRAVLQSIYIIFSAAFLFRTIAFSLMTALSNYPFILFLSVWTAVGFITLGTVSMIPKINPIHALMSISSSGNQGFPYVQWTMTNISRTIMIYWIIAAGAVVGAYAALKVLRARYRKRSAAT